MRADPEPSQAAAARAKTQKRPRPQAGLGPLGGTGLGAQLALVSVGRGNPTGPAQRNRAHEAGRRGRRPVGAGRGAIRDAGVAHAVGATRAVGALCAIGAPTPGDVSGAENAPGAGVERAQDMLGPCDDARGRWAARSAGEPRALGPQAQPAVDSLGHVTLGPQAHSDTGLGGRTGLALQCQSEEPAGPFRFRPPHQGADLELGPPAHDDHALLTLGVTSGVQPGDVRVGTDHDGVFRFGPWPPAGDEQREAASSGSGARDHLVPLSQGCQAVPLMTGGGTDHTTAVQRIRAAVMQVVSGEQREGPGSMLEAGPAAQGEDGSEADYVDCDP
ncbi:uncharacterized protein LOC120105560 [Phoenix dactylifera]|uniref:Uncharacterized protein LOC120105560 n=1 Tax=Phoenix dactylifera TaxID=42345 RepID=A0A8B8ZL64_PHODC|nr:uncharacterized protein LOC120105560 [Phoenix dactylifera]